MGKKRKNRGRKRNIGYNFHSNNIQRKLKDYETHESYKTKQKEYLQAIATEEQAILSRSVFITQVNDLRISSNLKALSRFLENHYGPVEKCDVAAYKGKRRFSSSSYPPARVRFRFKQDAEKIFKIPLFQANIDKICVPVSAPGVGYKDRIQVRPSDRYPDMTKDTVTGTIMDDMAASSLSLGHWFPKDTDGIFALDEDKNLSNNNEWVHEVTSRDVAPTLRIDLERRLIEISFPRTIAHRSDDFLANFMTDFFIGQSQNERDVLSIRFKDIVGYIDICSENKDNNTTFSLLFTLKHPPRIYYRWESEDFNDHRQDHESRVLEVESIASEFFGRCWSYKLDFDSITIDRLLVKEQLMDKLRKFGIFRKSFFSKHDSEDIHCRHFVYEPSIIKREMLKVNDQKNGLLLRSLLDRGRCCWYHCLNDKLQSQSSWFRYTPSNLFDLVAQTQTNTARKVLQDMCDMNDRTRYPMQIFHILANDVNSFDDDNENNGIAKVPSYCIEIPRIIITPTRICVVGFDIEMSNRVIRKFVTNEHFPPESFVRVTIADENGDMIFSDDLSPPLCDQIRSILNGGINVNHFSYKFLAYSSSQLKECSLWMVHETQQWKVRTMRQWMGDFSMCKTPSKYAARMGQCFSTTLQPNIATTTTASRTLLRTFRNTAGGLRVKDNLCDVESYHNSVLTCHSDGTGLIRKQVLTNILENLPNPPTNPNEVSIIQIRYGGAKGTLVGWDLDKRCNNNLNLIQSGYDVYLRPSMVKFKANYENLEVVSIGKNVPYYLNRHVILLLNAQGVSCDTFLEMQKSMLNDLDEMLWDRNKARELLPCMAGGLSSTLIEAIDSGASPDKDPFLFSCLHAMRAHLLMNLRKKARIYVPNGAVLMGGLDETGLLPEGCIFVQIEKSTAQYKNRTHESKNGYETLVGPVLVTKHPVMHPGDVRMLLAVDIPELRDHKNVILFSQQGTRPEADKMAGSDLDGDQFAVTWEPRLFIGEWNQCQRVNNIYWQSRNGCRIRANSDIADNALQLMTVNQQPMENGPSNSPSADENSPISDEKLIQHIIYHAKNDTVGRIATLWLDYAAKNGAHCVECVQLANLHSIAVDFPKSGIPAVIPDDLKMRFGVPRPHWRELKNRELYDDEGVLGRLYDDVAGRLKDANKALNDHPGLVGRSYDKHGQILCFVSQLGKHLGSCYDPMIPAVLGFDSNNGIDVDLIHFAKDLKYDYDRELLEIMSKYGLHSEGEIITGLMRKYHRLHKRRRHDVSEEVRRRYREVRKFYRFQFFEKVIEIVDEATSHLQDERMQEGYLDERLAFVEAAALKPFIDSTPDNGEVKMIQVISRKLAACCYMVTYSVDEQDDVWNSWQRPALFSFPWAFSDIMQSAFIVPR